MFALSGSANADMVTDWNTITLETIKIAKLTSTKASRVLAMVHAAIYDSVNAIDKTHDVYFVHTTANPDTSEEAAAAGILKLFFNDDNISFTVQPYMMGMPSMPRTYHRFSDASHEAGQSRIYGGIHYDFSNTSGLWAGNELSKYVLRTFMRPL